MTCTKHLARIVAAVVWFAVSGCGPMSGDHSKSSDAMPASAADAQTVQSIRDKYFRAYPESQVGVVIATLQGEPFVAVGDLPAPEKLRENEVVTFLDRNERVLTTGTIAQVRPTQVDVRYDAPPRGGRAPHRGDVMVRTPFGAKAL